MTELFKSEPTVAPPNFFLQHPLLARFLYQTGAILAVLFVFALQMFSFVNFGWIVWIVANGLSALLLLAATNLWRKGKRYKAFSRMLVEIPDDSRPVILHLRSFVLELPNNFARADYTTDYEIVNGLLAHLGQGITAAAPHERLPSINAAQVVHLQSEWQKDVVEMISRARLVVIYPGFSKGLNWEIEKTKELCPPEKILIPLLFEQPFVFDDAGVIEQKQRDWKAFRKLLEQGLNISLANDEIHKSMFLGFTEIWSPEFNTFNINVSKMYPPKLVVEETLNHFLEKRDLPKPKGFFFRSLYLHLHPLGIMLLKLYFIVQIPLQMALNQRHLLTGETFRETIIEAIMQRIF